MQPLAICNCRSADADHTPQGCRPLKQRGGGYPPPFDEGLGEYKAWPLSDAGGLTQFGAFTEELAPGAYSSLRHWHENEDEFVYVLAGEVTLIDDSGPQVLRPGDAATFKAGEPNGHRLHNATAAPVTYLVVGTRFQFRATGERALKAVAVTLPPWPGDGEAEFVKGKW